MNIPSVLKLNIILFFIVIAPIKVHALTPEQVFDKVKASVVVVNTLDAQGKVKGQGSGVLLPSGKIATNYHVVEGGASYLVGRGKIFVRATLYAEDGDKDICLLDAKGITGKPVRLGKAAGLKVGVPVYAVGAPQGLELSLSDGIVAQLRGGTPPLIQTTAAISPGSSGGGLFDREGRLVGLTTLYMEGGQNLNFAMPVEWINEIKPGRKTVANGRSQTLWLKRAIAFEKKEEWYDMIDWCRKWTEIEPNNAEAWYSLGVAYGKHKVYDDAINAYRQALRIKPEYAEAWNNLGVTYGKINRNNDAVDACRQALRIKPEYAEAWSNLGLFYGNLGRNDDAIDAYRQALRIKPEYAEAWNNLGIVYDALKRNNDAIDAYRQALRIKPEYADAWSNLGVDYYVSGNHSAALETVRELRGLDPEKADKLFNLIVPR
jgi:tetratricopeptide (TPR) repeat protein